MIFSAPEMWYWLGVLAIPIIIHLLFFKKYTTYYFSQLTDIAPKIIEKNQIKKIKKWLILALRTLALFALIMAFAQPKSSSENNHQRFIYLIDNSPSTSQLMGGVSLLDRIKKTAQLSIENSQPEAQFMVLTPASPFFNLRWLRASEALEKIKTIELQNKAFNFEQTVSQLRKIDPQTFELFFFSDGQKHSDIHLLGTHFPTHVLQANWVTDWSNIWIENVVSENAALHVGNNELLHVSLRRNSGESALDHHVKLMQLPSKKVKATTPITWKKGEIQKTISISFVPDSTEVLSVHIVANDLNFDNHFTFLSLANRAVNIEIEGTFPKAFTQFCFDIAQSNPQKEKELLLSTEPQSLQARSTLFKGKGIIGSGKTWDLFPLEKSSASSGTKIHYDVPFLQNIFLTEVDNPDLPTSANPFVFPKTPYGWEPLFTLENGAPGALYGQVNNKKILWLNASEKDTDFFSHPFIKILVFRFFELNGAKSILNKNEVLAQNLQTYSHLLPDAIPEHESSFKNWDADFFEEKQFTFFSDDSPSEILLNTQPSKRWFGYFLWAVLVLLIAESILVRKEVNV